MAFPVERPAWRDETSAEAGRYIVVRVMRSATSLAMVTLAVAVAALPSGRFTAFAAAKATEPVKSVVLRPRFDRVDLVQNPQAVLATGRYAVITSGTYTPAGTASMLLNERTGTRTPLTSPGCVPAALGTRWVLATCGSGSSPAFELYALSSGERRRVALAPRVAHFCDGRMGNCDVSAVAVGADWIEFDEQCSSHCNGDSLKTDTYVFQNIGTGVVRADPRHVGGSTTADLDSPSLAHKLCSPLRMPGGGDLAGSAPGSLKFYGAFAIANSIVNGPPPYLERCGSRLHEHIGGGPDESPLIAQCFYSSCPPVGNPNVIIWQSAKRQLRGLFLPSRRHFLINTPAAIGVTYRIALSSNTLYLLAENTANTSSHVWTATSPTVPRQHKRRHR